MAAVNMPLNQLTSRIFTEEAKNKPIHQPWIPDERDSFISWLRSEFAAANAIIDAMCTHLQQCVASVPGEYDHVLNCVRQRRYNWTAVLHMQQYFSVEEVVLSLQQVAAKRHQQHLHMHGIGSGENSKNVAPETQQSNSEENAVKDGAQDVEWSQAGGLTDKTEDRAAMVKVSKNFQAFENVDGRVINVVEGLRMCENVFNPTECDHFVSMLSDVQGGRKMELGATGYKVVGGKRYPRAKSNESTADSEEIQRSSSQEETSEALPVALQLIVDRLLECHLLPPSKRPDSYIINFLGSGGYLPPQTNNQEFEQPFCIVILQSECSMAFGRFITMDGPREFRSQFKLSVASGSVLVFQGNSAKLCRYAIPATSTKRCCLVLGKTSSKRFSRNTGFQRSASSSGLMNNRPAGLSPPGVSSPFPPPGANAAGPPFAPLPVMVPGWSPVPRPARFTGTGVFLPYNASSGPGRPNSNQRGKQQAGGGPVLQKMNSLPASFRTQNGVTDTGKMVEHSAEASSSSSSHLDNSQGIFPEEQAHHSGIFTEDQEHQGESFLEEHSGT